MQTQLLEGTIVGAPQFNRFHDLLTYSAVSSLDIRWNKPAIEQVINIPVALFNRQFTPVFEREPFTGNVNPTDKAT